MDIKTELFAREMTRLIMYNLEHLEVNMNEIVQSAAVAMLSEIQEALRHVAADDFETVERIVSIFEKYDIDCGARHDF